MENHNMLCIDEFKQSLITIGEIEYGYSEMYSIAEQIVKMTNLGIIICLNELFGDSIENILKWKENNKTISLQFSSNESYLFKFSKKTKIEIPTQGEIGQGLRSLLTKKIHKEIEEYYWEMKIEYKLIIFQGKDENSGIKLKQGNLSQIFKTRSKKPIRPKYQSFKTKNIILNDFLNQIQLNNSHMNVNKDFTIKKDQKNISPWYNSQILQINEFFDSFIDWNQSILEYIKEEILLNSKLDEESKKELELQLNSKINPCTYFILLDENKKYKLLNYNEQKQLLDKFNYKFHEKLSDIPKLIQNDKKNLLSISFIEFHFILIQMKEILKDYNLSIQYIENIQRKTFLDVIGNELDENYMSKFMKFYFRKIFKDKYKPKPFMYYIYNNKNSDSEGFIRILKKNEENQNFSDTIDCFVKKYENISITTNLTPSIPISFIGEKFIHCYLEHRFSTCNQSSFVSQFKLCACAKNFSQFVLIIGSCLSHNHIKIQHAIIINNLDDLNVLIELESLETPKAFQRFISSISKEQQEFANAYRTMQLSESLFVISIIPIQTQFERLLNLPLYSLSNAQFTKIYSVLLKLMVRYQLPSDLFTYQGPKDVCLQQKIDYILSSASYIISLLKAELLKQQKERLLEEERRKMDISSLVIAGDEIFTIPETSSGKNRRVPDAFLIPKKKKNRFFDMFKSPEKQQTSEIKDYSHSSKNLFKEDTEPINEPTPNIEQTNNNNSHLNVEQKKEQNFEANFDFYCDFDESKLPFKLDNAFSLFDEDDALHVGSLKISSDSWNRWQSTTGVESKLSDDVLKTENSLALDLIDALSRSGNLELINTSTHFISGITHWFDLSLMDTIIQTDINPISKLKNSGSIVASVLYDSQDSSFLDE